MVEQEYTLKELADETGVDPRKIRFYISEKLMAGPETRGRNARYTDYHLKRLRAIRILSEVYKLPLKEIRRYLVQAGDEDFEKIALRLHHQQPGVVAERLPPSSGSGMASFSRRVRMAKTRAPERYPEAAFEFDEIPDHAIMESAAASTSEVLGEPDPEEHAPRQKPTPLDTLIAHLGDAVTTRRLSHASSSRGESWRVIEITPEVKLQVKEVFSPEDMARFEEVAAHIREILLGGDGT